MNFETISEFLRSYWGLWLMLLFLGIVFYAFRPKNKDRHKDHGNIPFRDEDEER